MDTPGPDELHMRDVLISHGVHPAAIGPERVIPPMPAQPPTAHQAPGTPAQESDVDGTLPPTADKGEDWWDQLYPEATAGSRDQTPTPDRVRRIPRNGWRPYGPSSVDLDQAPAGDETDDAAEPVDEPVEAPAAPVPLSVVKGEQPEAAEDSKEAAEPETEDDASPADLAKTSPTSRARLIAMTVQEWRPPTGPRGRGWIRAVAYTGSGIVLGWLTGYTQAVYTTLDQLSVNPDAVGGIAISAAMAALMISRSKKTWIGLGCALLLVLVVEYLTVPVFAGAIATTVVWGLDQRARHMRHAIAWTIRAAFGSVLLASFALVWTTVVHYFTGAVQ